MSLHDALYAVRQEKPFSPQEALLLVFFTIESKPGTTDYKQNYLYLITYRPGGN